MKPEININTSYLQDAIEKEQIKVNRAVNKTCKELVSNYTPTKPGKLKRSVPENARYYQIKTVIDDEFVDSNGHLKFVWHSEVKFYDENMKEIIQ